MSLPRPTFSFAIPSVCDGTLLDCRLYQPKVSLPSGNVSAAIVAHPYAPLGGSYNDPVVTDVAEVLLNGGYIVGLFNLRGAGKSGGRTSWSSKPELADYVSFYGFMLHYLHRLTSYAERISVPEGESETSASDSAANTVPGKTTLILGGYSYGSLLVTYLPPVEQVLGIFRQPCNGSSEAIIRERALDLSRRWAKKIEEQRAQGRGRNRQSRSPNVATPGSLSVAVGDESTSRRTSRDSRRSMDIEGIRKSFDQVRARMHFGHMESSSDLEEDERQDEIHFTAPYTRHLLISPLLPPVSNFLTMFSRLSFEARTGTPTTQDHDLRLVLEPTLAIYGDSDTFTSKRKLRRWAEALARAPNSRFQFEEIRGAGHFWRHSKDQRTMQTTIGKWLHSEVSAGHSDFSK